MFCFRGMAKDDIIRTPQLSQAHLKNLLVCLAQLRLPVVRFLVYTSIFIIKIMLCLARLFDGVSQIFRFGCVPHEPYFNLLIAPVLECWTPGHRLSLWLTLRLVPWAVSSVRSLEAWLLRMLPGTTWYRRMLLRSSVSALTATTISLRKSYYLSWGYVRCKNTLWSDWDIGVKLLKNR